MASKKPQDALEAAKDGDVSDPVMVEDAELAAMEMARAAAPNHVEQAAIPAPTPVASRGAPNPPPPAVVQPANVTDYRVVSDKLVSNGTHQTWVRAGSIVSHRFGHRIDDMRRQGVQLEPV